MTFKAYNSVNRRDFNIVGARSSTDACDAGWLDAQSLGLGCLLFGTEGMTYYDSNTFCQDERAHLIEIQNQEQLDFVTVELQTLEADGRGHAIWWTAGSDMGRENQWYWQHSLTAVKDFVWGPGRPYRETVFNYVCFDRSLDYKANM